MTLQDPTSGLHGGKTSTQFSMMLLKPNKDMCSQLNSLPFVGVSVEYPFRGQRINDKWKCEENHVVKSLQTLWICKPSALDSRHPNNRVALRVEKTQDWWTSLYIGTAHQPNKTQAKINICFHMLSLDPLLSVFVMLSMIPSQQPFFEKKKHAYWLAFADAEVAEACVRTYSTESGPGVRAASGPALLGRLVGTEH